jgi:putative flippase GtrA
MTKTLPALDRGTGVQFARYFVTGLAAFVLEYLIFLSLNAGVGIWYLWAHIAAYAGGLLFSYFINRWWAFQSNDPIPGQLARITVLALANLLITSVLLSFCCESLHLKPPIAKLLIMAAVVMWNFVLYKKVIYRG